MNIDLATMGQLRILKCDGFDCNKKVESGDEGTLKELVVLCGWKNRDDRWICPECVKNPQRNSTKSKKPARRPESTL